MAHSVGRWISAGKTILMMTQVPYEGSDMEIYQVGQQVKKRYPMLETYNMTMEAAVTKLMWILGQTAQAHEISHLFYQPDVYKRQVIPFVNIFRSIFVIFPYFYTTDEENAHKP